MYLPDYAVFCPENCIESEDMSNFINIYHCLKLIYFKPWIFEPLLLYINCWDWIHLK